MNSSLEAIGLDIGNLLVPLFVICVAAVFTFTMIGFLKNLSVWIRLKVQGYKERDEVYLNGERAVITKIGFLSTTFYIMNGEGAIMRWESITNTRMEFQRIVRISLKLSRIEHMSTDPSYYVEKENEGEKHV